MTDIEVRLASWSVASMVNAILWGIMVAILSGNADIGYLMCAVTFILTITICYALCKE